MKERDILWEGKSGLFWVAKTKHGFMIFKNCGTHAKGFLSTVRLKDAIENVEAFEKKPETADRLLSLD